MLKLFFILFFNPVLSVPVDSHNVGYSNFFGDIMTNSEPYFMDPFHQEVPNSRNHNSESNHIIRLPYLSEDVILPEDGVPLRVPMEYGVSPDIPPPLILNNHYFRTPYEAEPVPYYEADDIANMDFMNGRIGYYGDGLYPQVYSSIPAALNTEPLSYLPPVYTTHILEKIPSVESDSNNDIDLLNQVNSDLLSPIRPRMRRQDEDFLAKWIHDATLNNILPTMPMFLRGAEKTAYDTNLGSQKPVVAYPDSPQPSVLPVLLGCSVQISRSSSLKPYSEHYGSPSAAYREDRQQANINPVEKDHLLMSAKSIANLKPFKEQKLD